MKPFCQTCHTRKDTRQAPLEACVATNDHYCPDCSRKCLGCGDIYAEKIALQILAENRLPHTAEFRCENCQFAHDEALMAKFEPQMELGLEAPARRAC